MFMLTIQKGNLKKLGAVALCGALIAAAAVAGTVVRKNAQHAVETSAPTPTSIASTQDIQSYFLGFGLEVDPTDITADKVKVPRKWDDSFAAFNKIVSQSGRDLTECKGKTVEKWLAAIPSLGDGGQTVYGVLLVRSQKVVGAYLLEKPSGNVSGLADVVQTMALNENQEESETAAQPNPDEEEPVSLDTEVAAGMDGFPAD